MTYMDDEDVVISGIGAKFPQANSTTELAEKLFAGENLLTKDERILTKGFYVDLPQYNGKTQVNSVLFDNTFFGISHIVATAIDPLTCQILQRTFEAVIDAGINPADLKGTNASVFSGTCHSDSDLEWATDMKAGYGIMGRNRCMNSNRVSYWLDLNGTSVSTDSGWTNGLSNLYLGWSAIKSGKCDTAIVSTANLQNHALITIQFKDFGCLSPDGISRTFDDNANGSCRSSAVVVYVLQRASVAKRNYATIGHIYFSCLGNRDEVINKPSERDWSFLFEEFYKQSKIDVNDVCYVEADGTSKREEDAEEMNAIAKVFCKNRKTPLLIGCIKSNIGNTEATSSFCGIAKAVISLEHGIVPKNLNYSTPNSLCPSLAKGELKVVEENTTIPSDAWVAVNSHGYGGTYGHIVLKANPKKKVLKYDGIPRLVLLSDRTNDYMDDLIEKVESLSYDPEFIGLLHEIHSKKVEKYLGRGYTILPKPEKPVHDHQVFNERKRPVWFIFSGMGSQWPKMGRRLMDLPLFRESIEKSHKILEAKGLDLIKIITTEDPTIFDNILHSFVGIAAIQIALVDILRALKITPDGLIGHSVGELGCAYADDCFTAEQMLLAAYYRGRASTETELIKGSMAAIGKGYNDIKDQLPEGIEVACHNSYDSCTLSGPVDLIHKFVAELKNKGIFAKSVNVSNIAYHSRYIKPAAPKLLEYLKQVVTDPKPRSSKWISTSNPESKWNTDVAKYCSAEYHTNNLLSSVLFEEGSKHIPKNAICIEIAPHGLLQAILKRSLGEGVTNIPLTSKTCEDSLIFLLQSIGKMYMEGLNPYLINLYPKIEFPVSRGTHSLHPLVHWHDQETAIVVTPMEKKVVYSFKDRLVETANDDTGYIAHGQNIYPVSVFLDLAWDIFASFYKKQKEDCPVVFHDFQMENLQAVHLSEDDNGTITFHRGSGNFEIFFHQILARGTISLLQDPSSVTVSSKVDKWDLVGDEIYTELQRKGYTVGESYKTITAVSIKDDEITALIPVNVNWCQHIEAIFQLNIINRQGNLDSLRFPCAFQRLEISTLMHNDYKISLGNAKTMPMIYDPITNVAKCGGIELRGLKTLEIPQMKNFLNFESESFMPLMNPPLGNALKFVDFCISIVADNSKSLKSATDIHILEIMEDNQPHSVGHYIQQSFHENKDILLSWQQLQWVNIECVHPLKMLLAEYGSETSGMSFNKIKVKTVTNSTPPTKIKEKFGFIIASVDSVEKYINELAQNGFIFLRSSPGKKIPVGFNVIGKYQEKSNEFLLLKQINANPDKLEFIMSNGDLKQLILALQNTNTKEKSLCVVVLKEPTEGIADFKKAVQGEIIVPLRWCFIIDPKAPLFDSQNIVYKEQLAKGLITNIFKNGAWGHMYKFNYNGSVYHNDFNFSLESAPELEPSHVALDPTENLLKLQQIEFSGKINNTKVIGIAELLNYKKIVLDKNLTWEIPESWSLEDAATMPLAYSLAYYSLVIVGRTLPKERVLITDGLSCLGQASITLALEICSRVIVTVNNKEEAIQIKKKFPQLNEKDILNHNDLKFEIYWKLEDPNNSAEVIINTLDGDKFFSILGFVAKFGRMFHFGRENMRKNKELGSSIFLMSLKLYAMSPAAIVKMCAEDKKKLHELMTKGVKSGLVKPLPKTVVTFNEFKKIKSDENPEMPKRIKTIVPVSSIVSNPSYIKFSSTSSFVVIGDETDLWINVAEWLIDRKVENIVISRKDRSKRSQLSISYLKKYKNVVFCDHQNVTNMIQEAKKLGPLSAVIYMGMSSVDENTLKTLDKTFRDPKSHLVVLTRTQGFASEICLARNDAGFPSTNFIWKADDMLIDQNLEFMTKLNGRQSMIRVSALAKLLQSEQRLSDIIPSCIDDFCDLGSSLENEVRITPLQTLSGNNREPYKEFTPTIFIPGLDQDPVKMLQPLVTDFLYPAYCLQLPNLKMSIPKMACYVLPELKKFNKGEVFNIVGISWGTHLAMEIAKQLEDLGCIVGLILISGPLMNPSSLVTKSLELDIINLILEYSKTSKTIVVRQERSSEKTWMTYLYQALSILNLSPEKEKNFINAATYVYNNVQALLDYDLKKLKLKGPLTFLLSTGHVFDSRAVWKISKSISVRYLPISDQEMLTSPRVWKTILGTLVSPAMSKSSIRDCSWPALEEFMSQKVNVKLGADFHPIQMKFSFTF